MSIYDVEGELGGNLYKVLSHMQRAIVAMERIPEEQWSDEMDLFHKKLSDIITRWEYVELKE